MTRGLGATALVYYTRDYARKMKGDFVLQMKALF